MTTTLDTLEHVAEIGPASIEILQTTGNWRTITHTSDGLPYRMGINAKRSLYWQVTRTGNQIVSGWHDASVWRYRKTA